MVQIFVHDVPDPSARRFRTGFLQHFAPSGRRTLVYCDLLFPQQRKLVGSSAQISSGVCRRGSPEQVPEAGSRNFWRLPACLGLGAGGRFRTGSEVPECSGPEGPGGVAASSGEFRRVLAKVAEASSAGFRRVPVCAGVGSGGRVRKVPKISGAATLTGAAMWLFWTLAGDHIPLRKNPHNQNWHKNSYIY